MCMSTHKQGFEKSIVVQLSEFNSIEFWDTRWGCSSVGRAPALQAGGQGFESLHLHQISVHGAKHHKTKLAVDEGLRKKTELTKERTR